jgi:signal transduction histidine kinase
VAYLRSKSEATSHTPAKSAQRMHRRVQSGRDRHRPKIGPAGTPAPPTAVSPPDTLHELAALLTHELSQPLAAIHNYARGGLRHLEGGTATTAELAEAMQEIADSAIRAGEIIRTLRNLVRQSPPERQRVDPNDLVLRAARTVRPECRQRSIALELDLGTGLPHLQLDPAQMELVLGNLLRNALEAMDDTPPERRELVVRTARAAGNHVELAVLDRGVGADEDALPRLFTPSYTTKPHGLGIGLWVSRAIVQAHEGCLWAEQRPGGGAIFRLVLPVSGSGTNAR